MPLADWDDPLTFQALYRYENAPGVVTHYARASFATGAGGLLPKYETRAIKLIALGMLPTERILIAGCGFGYLVEALRNRGYSLCWGIDGSSDVQGRWATEQPNYDANVVLVSDTVFAGGRVRAALRNLTGDDEFDWVIDEDLLPCFTDTEIPAAINWMEAGLLPGRPLSQLVHGVSYLRDGQLAASFSPLCNWKTKAQWQAYAPSHTWCGPTFGDVW